MTKANISKTYLLIIKQNGQGKITSFFKKPQKNQNIIPIQKKQSFQQSGNKIICFCKSKNQHTMQHFKCNLCQNTYYLSCFPIENTITQTCKVCQHAKINYHFTAKTLLFIKLIDQIDIQVSLQSVAQLQFLQIAWERNQIHLNLDVYQVPNNIINIQIGSFTQTIPQTKKFLVIHKKQIQNKEKKFRFTFQPYKRYNQKNEYLVSIFFGDYLEKKELIKMYESRLLHLNSSQRIFSQQFNKTQIIKLSFICPISKKRINNPARGLNCKHFQCFDLQQMVQINYKNFQSDWLCPICNKKAKQLFIDVFVSIMIKENLNLQQMVLNEKKSIFKYLQQHQSIPNIQIYDMNQMEIYCQKFKKFQQNIFNFLDQTATNNDKFIPQGLIETQQMSERKCHKKIKSNNVQID